MKETPRPLEKGDVYTPYEGERGSPDLVIDYDAVLAMIEWAKKRFLSIGTVKRDNKLCFIMNTQEAINVLDEAVDKNEI